MSGTIKQMFIVMMLVLLGFRGSLTIKFLFMYNQTCMFGLTLIDFSPDVLHYYLLITNLDRYDGSCNTVEDPFGRICVPNKIDDVKFKVFNMIKEIKIIKITCGSYFIRMQM